MEEVKECDLCLNTEKLIKLINCEHEICGFCFTKTVLGTPIYPIDCPCCDQKLKVSQIRTVLDKDALAIYDNNQIIHATAKHSNRAKCRQVDCPFVGLVDTSEGRDQYWICLLCKSNNCLYCKAIHERNQSCAEYQATADCSAQKSMDNGDFMECTKCHIYIERSRGCDYIMCMRCKTELCWSHKTEFQKEGCDCSDNLRHVRNAFDISSDDSSYDW